MKSFFHHLGQRRSASIAALAGLLYPLGFAPYGWYLLSLVGIAILLMTMTKRTPKQAAFNGFVFGITAYLTSIYWITISVHTFGGAPYALAVFLMLALVLFLSGYYALLGYGLVKYFSLSNPWLVACVFASLWTVLEWMRGWVLSGFGWMAPGYAHVDSVLLGYLPVGGALSAGWVVGFSAAMLSALLLTPTRRTGVALFSAGLLWALGLVLAHISWTQDNGETTTVSLVQGSVPQDIKWHPDQLQPTIDLYLDLSAKHLDSDVIVWPEAAIPLYKHLLDTLWQELHRVSEATDTTFIVGTVEFDQEEGVRHNSMTAFTQTEQVYRKRILVPFGEFFPVPNFIKERMRMMNLPYQNFSAGADGQPPLAVANQTISPSICYEDVFGHRMLDSVKASSLLINVSNDAWFGGSLAPHQHLQISRTRAAEAGRYMLRGTNNGISAVINRYGRTLEQSPQFEPFVLTATVPGTDGLTPYSRWGDWPIVLLSMLVLALSWIRSR